MHPDVEPIRTCACGRSVDGAAPLCPRCGRFRHESALRAAESDSRAGAPPSPRRHPRLPLVLLLLVLAAMIAFFRAERERPWEEMPELQSRPTGSPVTVGLDFGADREAQGYFTIELSRFEFSQADRSERGQARIGFQLRVVPADRGSRGGHVVEPKLRFHDFRSMPDAFAGWEEFVAWTANGVEGPHGIGHLAVELARRIRSQSFRMGESVAVAFDTEAFASLAPRIQPGFGRSRGWIEYAVQSAGRVYLVVRVRGGIRVEFSEDLEHLLLRAGRRSGRPVETMLVRSFLRPLGAMHRLRARLEGEIRCDHRTGLPARGAVSVDFVLTGVKEGKPYTLTGTLLVRNPDWIRFEPD